MDTCAFCGRDPYHRVDVGFGLPGVAVAITCCEAGIMAYGRGPDDEMIDVSAAELRKIAAQIDALKWEVQRRERKAAKVAGIARVRLARMQAAG